MGTLATFAVHVHSDILWGYLSEKLNKAWPKESAHGQAREDFVQLPTAFEKTGEKFLEILRPGTLISLSLRV